LLESKKFHRDLATLEVYEATDHNASAQYNYTINTAETTIFSANTSCILTPEVTDGPYYVTGESIRKNVTEGQEALKTRNFYLGSVLSVSVYSQRTITIKIPSL